MQVSERKRKEEAEANKALAEEMTAKDAATKVNVAAFMKQRDALEAAGKGPDGRPVDASEMSLNTKAGGRKGGKGGKGEKGASAAAATVAAASNPFDSLDSAAAAAGAGAEGGETEGDSDIVV